MLEPLLELFVATLRVFDIRSKRLFGVFLSLFGATLWGAHYRVASVLVGLGGMVLLIWGYRDAQKTDAPKDVT